MKFITNPKNKIKSKITIALMLLTIYISLALSYKLQARSKSNNKLNSLKTHSNLKNALEYFSNDENKFPGKLIYDFGLYGKFYASEKGNSTEASASASNSTNHTVLSEGDLGNIIYVKKIDDKNNGEYVLKIVEDVDEKVYREMFRKTLALVMQHSIRAPKQTTHYFGAKTYFKNNKKSIAIAMDYIKGKTLFEVFRNPAIYLTNKQQIMNLIYSVIKAVNEFHTYYRRTHYDIKPQNILVKDATSNCQKAILINLEGSLTPAEESFAPIRIITKFYTSPHFNNDKKQIQRFTDVYALGVVVLQTLGNVVGVHMKYSEEFFHKTQEKYIEELVAKKAEFAKFLTGDEFEELMIIGKSLLNHQNPQFLLEMIEKKFLNFVCPNN